MVAPRSMRIGKKAAQTIYYAVGEQAQRIGLPLTHHVTINFSLTDIDPATATTAFAKLRRNYFDKWARRPRRGAGTAFAPAYAYVFENSRDGRPFETVASGEPHNVHVHWVLHLPADRVYEFKMKMFEWLDGFCKVPSEARAVRIDEVYEPKGLRRYVLTGTDDRWAARYGAQHESQGLVIGRRTGTTVNLGPSARLALDRKLGVYRRAA